MAWVEAPYATLDPPPLRLPTARQAQWREKPDEAPQAILDLDEALGRLADEAPSVAALVKLRYFAGLTAEQAAQALGISVRTANRDWAYAKAWLYQQLSG